MTSQPAMEIERTAAVRSFDPSIAALLRWSFGALAGLLLLAAVLVAWRRLAGALGSPLDPGVLLCVGALLAFVAVGLRMSWDRLALPLRARAVGWGVRGLLSAAVLIMAVSVSVAGTAPGALAAFWALVAAEELWAWRRAIWRKHRSRQGKATRDPPAPPPAPSHAEPAESEPVAPIATAVADDVVAPVVSAIPDDSLPSQDVLQQLTRSQAADGSQELSGWLQDRFEAGQRTSNVHVAFCPPFSRTPEVTVEHVGGPSTRIKTAQVLPYGVRLDLKLAAKAEEPTIVLLRFSARE